MKIMSLIPKKIKEQYHIVKRKGCLEVHSPAYVNIDFDRKFEIYQSDTTVNITNNKCAVTLWKNVENMHITILK